MDKVMSSMSLDIMFNGEKFKVLYATMFMDFLGNNLKNSLNNVIAVITNGQVGDLRSKIIEG